MRPESSIDAVSLHSWVREPRGLPSVIINHFSSLPNAVYKCFILRNHAMCRISGIYRADGRLIRGSPGPNNRIAEAGQYSHASRTFSVPYFILGDRKPLVYIRKFLNMCDILGLRLLAKDTNRAICPSSAFGIECDQARDVWHLFESNNAPCGVR